MIMPVTVGKYTNIHVLYCITSVHVCFHSTQIPAFTKQHAGSAGLIQKAQTANHSKLQIKFCN